MKSPMQNKPKESDWRRFSKLVPSWRERYLEKKNKEILLILIDENNTPTERFWNAERRMAKEAKILRDCLDGHSRSSMFRYLILMYGYKLIEEPDLSEFSDELRTRVLASDGA